MKEKKLLIRALTILYYSCGERIADSIISDCNDLLEYYEKEFDVQINARLEKYEYNLHEVIDAIEAL